VDKAVRTKENINTKCYVLLPLFQELAAIDKINKRKKLKQSKSA
jgi:hypothetical protein